MQIASNGTSFHCRIDGSGGPWVMLAHGLAADLTMWDELTDALKDRYRVLRKGLTDAVLAWDTSTVPNGRSTPWRRRRVGRTISSRASSRPSKPR